MTRESLFASVLPDGRLHLQEGPIDLVVEAFGEVGQVRRAYAAAQRCFEDVLPALVAELPALRSAVPYDFEGPVARRMAAACAPHRETFVTPMAAVAGAVADHVLAAMTGAAKLTRAYVNDGGDIALYLAPGERFACGLVAELQDPRLNGKAVIAAATPIRGIATSGRATLGQGGRSFSRGIADAVTVFARTAAAADVAATLIANAVDLPGHPAVRRQPACEIDPDSDLGARLVTVGVGVLSREEIEAALARGLATARAMQTAGLIEAAVLFLHGAAEVVDEKFQLLPVSPARPTPSDCHPGQANLRARAGTHGRGRAPDPTMDPRVKPEDDSEEVVPMARGLATARAMQTAGLIEAAVLFLRGAAEVVDEKFQLLPVSPARPTHSDCHPGQASLRARAGTHGRGRAPSCSMGPRVKPEGDSGGGGRDDSLSEREQRVAAFSAGA